MSSKVLDWKGMTCLPEDRLAFLRGLARGWFQEEEFREDISALSGHDETAYLSGEVVADMMLDPAADVDAFRILFAEMIEKYPA